MKGAGFEGGFEMMREKAAGRYAFVVGVLTLSALVAACSDDDPVGPGAGEQVATLTVDANDWTYVSLGDPSRVVTVSDPAKSTAWDLAFHATSVTLNGGAAGPGGVVGYCVCQNASATDSEIAAMTPESELRDFLDVGVADLPADEAAWRSDALVPVISGWYAYDFATHTVSALPEKVWKLRTAEGDSYAKFHVTAIEGAARGHAGRVTFEYAVQSGRGEAMGPTRTETVDLSSGAVYFDLVDGVVSNDSDWDLRFEGYTIQVNGGVSGPGQAGAVIVDEPFDAITDASDLEGLYRGDVYGGVFDAHRWYRYDLRGNHQIWPTYDVYLIRRGDEVYKVQLTSYYSATGDSRHITFRYARLDAE